MDETRRAIGKSLHLPGARHPGENPASRSVITCRAPSARSNSQIDAPMAVKRFLFVLILLTAGGVARLRTRQGWATKAGSYEVTPSRSGRRPGGGRRIVRRPAPRGAAA